MEKINIFMYLDIRHRENFKSSTFILEKGGIILDQIEILSDHLNYEKFLIDCEK